MKRKKGQGFGFEEGLGIEKVLESIGRTFEVR